MWFARFLLDQRLLGAQPCRSMAMVAVMNFHQTLANWLQLQSSASNQGGSRGLLCLCSHLSVSLRPRLFIHEYIHPLSIPEYHHLRSCQPSDFCPHLSQGDLFSSWQGAVAQSFWKAAAGESCVPASVRCVEIPCLKTKPKNKPKAELASPVP